MTPNIWRVAVFVFGLLLILTGLVVLALGHLQHDDDSPLPAPPASRVVQVGGT